MNKLDEDDLKTMDTGIILIMVLLICMNIFYLGEHYDYFKLKVDEHTQKAKLIVLSEDLIHLNAD